MTTRIFMVFVNNVLMDHKRKDYARRPLSGERQEERTDPLGGDDPKYS